MQINQGNKLDQKRAQVGLQILPRSKFDLITIVNTGMEVIRAHTGNKYAVTLEALEPTTYVNNRFLSLFVYGSIPCALNMANISLVASILYAIAPQMPVFCIQLEQFKHDGTKCIPKSK
jgi:hypothetical protein